MAVAIAVASLGTAGVAALSTATPGGATPPACTDSWQGPATGTINWNASAANWSTGFPTSASVVCIQKPGTYTVDLTSNANSNISALLVGGSTSGTQTLVVDGSATNEGLTLAAGSEVASGGVLTLAAGPVGFALINGAGGVTVDPGGTFTTTGATSTAYLRTNLTSNGSVTIGAANTQQDQGTTTSTSGSFTVSAGGALLVGGSGAFTHSGGSLSLAGSLTENSGTFTESGGAGSGSPVVLTGGSLVDSAGTGAFDVTGTIGFSGTIPVGQTVTVDGSVTNVTLNLGGSVTDDGALILDPSTGFAMVESGALTVAPGASLTTNGASNTAYLRTNVTNNGSVTIGAANTQQDQTTATTNGGTFTVSAGGKIVVGGSGSFTNQGTLTVNGSFSQTSGTFTQTSGSVVGAPVVISSGTLVDTAGTGAFDVTGTVNFSGNIPSGQTVTVDGSVTNEFLNLITPVTDSGTLNVDPSTGFAALEGDGLTVAPGASLTTAGAGNIAYLRTDLTNNGSVTIGSLDTRLDEATTTTNAGTFTVSATGKVVVGGSGAFTNQGTLTVNGSFSETSGTFTQTSGSIVGAAVVISSGVLVDTAGTGAFDVTGTVNFSGNIPSGQTVTADGSVTNLFLNLITPVTDSGTLNIDPSTGFVGLEGDGLTVASGGLLTTSGASNQAYIRSAVTNASGGTVTIGALDSRQDTGTVTTNSGTLRVVNGGHLALSSGSTLVNSAVGTIGVTVNGTAGGISGPGTTLAAGSTLSVTTVGSPSIGTVFTPIGGPVTGTFTNLSFGPAAYAVAYPAGAVQLTTEAPYTFTASPLTPKENVPTGTVTLGTIGSASDGTGIYSATVNWGDGSGTGPATVNVTGSTGTVTGSHTYTTPGTYTVTCALANTDGTVITTSESVTVTGPVVTGFSKVSITHGKKLTTKVSGTGLDASAVVTTSNPGVTVVSVKASKVSKKHPNVTLTVKLAAAKTAALGPINVTITETGGTTTVLNAITVK